MLLYKKIVKISNPLPNNYIHNNKIRWGIFNKLKTGPGEAMITFRWHITANYKGDQLCSLNP